MSAERWSTEDRRAVANAVVLAPSVHNLQPWRLGFSGRYIKLYRRRDLALRRHDPSGRDITISCGAALANIEVAVARQGRRPRTELFPAVDEPDLVASIRGDQVRSVTDVDRRLSAAMEHRRSYRAPFTCTPVSPHLVDRIVGAVPVSDVYVRVVRAGENRPLARALEIGWEYFRRDSGYQCELNAWTIWDETAHKHGVGIAHTTLAEREMPWAGLARTATPETDQPTLSSRLAAETVAIVVAPDDSPRHQLLSGAATQYGWLAAVSSGLAAAMITQPLHLQTVRDHLVKEFALAGTPHVLLRMGYPQVAVPQSPRRSVYEVLD